MSDIRCEGRIVDAAGEFFDVDVPAQLGRLRAGDNPGERAQVPACAVRARVCRRMRDASESPKVGDRVALLVDPEDPKGLTIGTIIHVVKAKG